MAPRAKAVVVGTIGEAVLATDPLGERGEVLGGEGLAAMGLMTPDPGPLGLKGFTLPPLTVLLMAAGFGRACTLGLDVTNLSFCTGFVAWLLTTEPLVLGDERGLTASFSAAFLASA